MKLKTKSFHDTLKRIGDGLLVLRKKSGYPTLREFTRRFKLPLIQYWRIEKGKANFTIKTLFQLLSIHKVSLEKFFGTLQKNAVRERVESGNHFR